MIQGMTREEQYLMKYDHEPIIDLERFDQVQAEMKCRSNIEIVYGKAREEKEHIKVVSVISRMNPIDFL